MTYNLIEISSGLSTPVIGFVAAYIACQQWKTNRDKLKQDMFDRRFAVFEIVSKCTHDAWLHRTADEQEIDTFDAELIRAPFLFDQKLNSYLNDINKKIHKLRSIQWELKGNEGSGEKEKNVAVNSKRKKICDELKIAHNELHEKFSPFLKLNH